jgi:hypothetical protein
MTILPQASFRALLYFVIIQWKSSGFETFGSVLSRQESNEMTWLQFQWKDLFVDFSDDTQFHCPNSQRNRVEKCNKNEKIVVTPL